MSNFVGMVFYSFLSFVYMSALLSSTNKERKAIERFVDLVIGVITFTMFMMYRHIIGSAI